MDINSILSCYIQSGPAVRVVQHGRPVEAAVYFHLREQQIRHGDVCGASVSQHRLLQERRLHTGNQSETHKAAGEKKKQNVFIVSQLWRDVFPAQTWLNFGVLGSSCSVSVGRTLQLACKDQEYNRRTLTVCPGSCRCEHALSCLMLMYDTAHTHDSSGKPEGTAVRTVLLLITVLIVLFSYWEDNNYQLVWLIWGNGFITVLDWI